MNFKEKLAMSKEKTEELKAKIAASAENAKKAHEAKKDEIKSNIDELNAEIDEFEKEFDDELEAGASLAIEEAGKALNKLGNELNKQAELDANAVEGGITAAKENTRIARERAQSKLNTARLKAQMRVNAAKEKIAQIKRKKKNRSRSSASRTSSTMPRTAASSRLQWLLKQSLQCLKPLPKLPTTKKSTATNNRQIILKRSAGAFRFRRIFLFVYFYVEPYDFAEFFYLLDVISVNNGEMVAAVSLGERVTELSCASLDFIVNGRRTFDVAVRTAEYFAAS